MVNYVSFPVSQAPDNHSACKSKDKMQLQWKYSQFSYVKTHLSIIDQNPKVNTLNVQFHCFKQAYVINNNFFFKQWLLCLEFRVTGMTQGDYMDIF